LVYFLLHRTTNRQLKSTVLISSSLTQYSDIYRYHPHGITAS